MDLDYLKESLKKTWDFIWNNNSIYSWVISLVLAFIIVKFIFFPSLSLILGTKLPLVVIESCSMYHKTNSDLNNVNDLSEKIQGNKFDRWWAQNADWYEKNNISKQDFEVFSFKNGMNKGDIIVPYGRFNPEIGDVMVFNANQKYPIIHRVVNIETLSTKGDNNINFLPGGIEHNIKEEQIIGKAILKIPLLGWVKLFFVDLAKGKFLEGCRE